MNESSHGSCLTELSDVNFPTECVRRRYVRTLDASASMGAAAESRVWRTELSDVRSWRFVVREWPRFCRGFLRLHGPLLYRRPDVCLWTSPTLSRIRDVEASSFWRRRSIRCRDPATLTWCNVRSSPSVLSRGRSASTRLGRFRTFGQTRPSSRR